jgi:hypothetical protein
MYFYLILLLHKLNVIVHDDKLQTAVVGNWSWIFFTKNWPYLNLALATCSSLLSIYYVGKRIVQDNKKKKLNENKSQG